MNQLGHVCKNLKKDFTPKIRDPSQPVRSWAEEEVLDNRRVSAYVIILRTRGCSWMLRSGCSMCGYFNDSLMQKVSESDLLRQFDQAMTGYSGEKMVKLFTSGSFFDNTEIPHKVRNSIMETLAKKAEKVIVESRPEYITNISLSELKQLVPSTQIEIGIGLETASDYIREHAINKGFTFNEYRKAAQTVHNHAFYVKTYVLIKPPFLTEQEAINDSINTIYTIASDSDTISFNPTNVQRNTLVEYLWKRNQYRPPWLWSIIDILQASKQIAPTKRIQCDVAGGGSKRGAHNCKSCDKEVLEAIASFSLSQDLHVFADLDCDCKDKWRDQLDLEPMGFGSLVDLSRSLS